MEHLRDTGSRSSSSAWRGKKGTTGKWHPSRDEGRANLRNLFVFQVFTIILKSNAHSISHLTILSSSIVIDINRQESYFQEEGRLSSIMRFSLILASLLPLLASVNPLPLESRQSTLDPFSLIAGRSGSPIHLSAINANGESFWIGKNTGSYCPSEEVTDCPAGIYTELLAGDGGASMVNPPLHVSSKHLTHHSTPKFPAAKSSMSFPPARSPSPSPMPKANPRKTMAPRPDFLSPPAQITPLAFSASLA